MPARALLIFLTLLLFVPNTAAKLGPLPNPFAILREGYARGSADMAADAYAEDAVYTETYPDQPSATRHGRGAIRAGFATMFRDLRLGPDRSADLNFRLAPNRRSGLYRLRVPGMPAGYGRFEVQVSQGRFTWDQSGPASRDDFEDAPGPLLFADPEEELNAEYYDRSVGRYLRNPSDPCGLTITRSIRRYFLLDECSGAWRGLNRQSGVAWTAGARVLDPQGNAPLAFAADRGSLTWSGSTYTRADTITRTPVTFASNVELAGTLYRPRDAAGPLPAAVLIHGSGSQDRNGYASLMALYAEHLARRGFVVLSFDKRGTGGSRGDWAAAGFQQLAADVNAARLFLAVQPGIDPARIGYMGSSQAGWVATQAIRDGGHPAFVILSGAAGAALTVEEQNLYNTEVRMRCAGIAEPDITLALAQQRAFFAAKRDPDRAAALATATERASGRPAIADWLFPASAAPGATRQWYDVLDPTLDPLHIWRSYRGRAFFLFGGFDDSTPTALATDRLRALPNTRTVVLPGAQHIGLSASTLCAGELDSVSGFDPGFFPALDRELAAIIGDFEP